MKIIDAWIGSPQEQEAIENARTLRGKSSLSKSNREILLEGQRIEEKITRRRFIMSGIGGGAAVAAAGLGFELYPQNKSVHPSGQESNALFVKNGPDIIKPEERDMLIQASAEFYCNNAFSNYPAQELARRTTFVPTKREYTQIAIAKGMLAFDKTVSAQAVETAYGNAGLGQTSPQGEVFVNLQGIEEDMPRFVKAGPLGEREIQQGDLMAEIANYTLLHEYGHVSETKKAFSFPTPLSINFSNGPFYVLGISGLNLRVITPNTPTEKVAHSDEALIDTQAYALCEKAGNPITQFLHNRYDIPRGYVNILNQAAGINATELSRVISGRSSIVDMLRAWGNTTVFGTSSHVRTPEDKLGKGVLALGIIGGVTEGWISQDLSKSALQIIFSN